MPQYDYVCLDCKQRFDVFFTYAEYGTKPAACAHCQSGNVRRRVPRVRVAKSEESRMENLADPSALAGLEDDPKALGQMMRKMGREMGEELPPEFDDVVDRLESGQSPEEIESALPDLGGDMGGMGGMGMGDMDF
jgi:putative FmdB family regulatory protein